MLATSEKLADFLQAQHWDAFFTSTFARHQRYSSTAIKRVHTALYEPRLRPTKAFIAAEQHRLGGWHCHGLLEFPQSKHFQAEVGLTKLTLAELGFNMVSSVNDLEACSVYLSKYIVKGEFNGDWRTYGRPKFWRGKVD